MNIEHLEDPSQAPQEQQLRQPAQPRIRPTSSSRRRWRPWAAALVLLTALGCGETFQPASYVDRLRILAIQADPPEVAAYAPAEGEEIAGSSRLAALVADPAQLEDPEREVSVLYLGCTPDPRQPFQEQLCTSYAMLQDPAALAALLAAGAQGDGSSCDPDEGGGTPERQSPIAFLGGERCSLQRGAAGCDLLEVPIGDAKVELPPPTYRPPDHLRLEELPAGDPLRILGLQATAVAIAIVATTDELLAGIDLADPCSLTEALGPRLAELLEERESVVAVKRIQLRGPDASDPPNLNPLVSGISLDEIPLSASAPEALVRGKRYLLRSILPDDPPDLRQRFSRYDSNGRKLREDEEGRLYSFFATGGSLERLRVREPDEANRWTAPTGEADDPIPPSGRVFLYTVVRDMRGGVDWAVGEVLFP